jgi:hypothetical protein
VYNVDSGSINPDDIFCAECGNGFDIMRVNCYCQKCWDEHANAHYKKGQADLIERLKIELMPYEVAINDCSNCKDSALTCDYLEGTYIFATTVYGVMARVVSESAEAKGSGLCSETDGEALNPKAIGKGEPANSAPENAKRKRGRK